MSRQDNVSSRRACSQVLLYAVLMLAVGVGVNGDLDEQGQHEKQLLYDLLEKTAYNKLVRPVRNNNDTLNIRFALALSQIISVDEVNQVMKTNVWLQMYWSDYQLAWDPLQYGGIKSIRLNVDKVWTPDFVLYNNADGNYGVSYKSNVVIYSHGENNWIPPAIYKSSCLVDVQYFPFDQQQCEMVFGSGTLKGNALNYTFDIYRNKLDIGDYLKSGTWDIIDGPADIFYTKDSVTGESRTMIRFTFVLRRKTLFYTVNLITPVLLTSIVSVCVFALPSDAGEKVTLCISVLLALVVFMLLVSKLLPPALSIPLLAKYLLFTFIVNLCSIFFTVVIINISYRTPKTHNMPYWMRVVFLRELPRFLFMTRPDHLDRWRDERLASTTQSLADISQARKLTTDLTISSDMLEMTDAFLGNNYNNSHDQRNYSTIDQHGRDVPLMQQDNDDAGFYDGNNPDRDYPDFERTPELNQAIAAIKYIYNYMLKDDEYETVLEDWRYLALVLDRLLLIIFVTVTMSGTASMFLNAPHILESVDQDKILDELAAYTKGNEARWLSDCQMLLKSNIVQICW